MSSSSRSRDEGNTRTRTRTVTEDAHACNHTNDDDFVRLCKRGFSGRLVSLNFSPFVSFCFLFSLGLIHVITLALFVHVRCEWIHRKHCVERNSMHFILARPYRIRHRIVVTRRTTSTRILVCEGVRLRRRPQILARGRCRLICECPDVLLLLIYQRSDRKSSGRGFEGIRIHRGTTTHSVRVRCHLTKVGARSRLHARRRRYIVTTIHGDAIERIYRVSTDAAHHRRREGMMRLRSIQCIASDAE